VWQSGKSTNLSPLEGGRSSWAFAINGRGSIAGQSRKGEYLDDEKGPKPRAVVWTLKGS
jgi:hypothetical protein